MLACNLLEDKKVRRSGYYVFPPPYFLGDVEAKELEFRSFEGDDSSSDEWKDYGMAGDDYEGPPIFDDDQYEEESMPVYDTDIEDVIEEEEGFTEKRGFGGKEDNIEDVVVMANDLCCSMFQTTLNVDFEEDINTKSHELVSFAKSIIIKGHWKNLHVTWAHLEKKRTGLRTYTNIDQEFLTVAGDGVTYTTCRRHHEDKDGTLLYGRESLTLEDILSSLNSWDLKKRTDAKDDGDGLYDHLKKDCPKGNKKKATGFVKKNVE
ncbi:hypothetical protein Tco_1532374 [Tanacetum coccineum]